MTSIARHPTHGRRISVLMPDCVETEIRSLLSQDAISMFVNPDRSSPAKKWRNEKL